MTRKLHYKPVESVQVQKGAGSTSAIEEREKLPAEIGADDLASLLGVADESRERLLSFMVHEIRNPLASALWATEMLARKPMGEPRSDRLAQLSARSVRRLRTLLEDLFALERVPARPKSGCTDLRQAIDRALSPHDLEPEGIPATVDAPPGMVVDLDPALLDRLLHSCLRRLRHAAADGPLAVQLIRAEPMAVLSLFREGLTVADVDPPPLTTGGSEGAGTTFALLVARAFARRLGVALRVEPTATGVAIRLGFPLEHQPAT